MRRLHALFAAVLLIPAIARAGAGDVRSTVHNLSVSGPGPIHAASEDRVCIFCHTPHNATPATPLWNHRLSGQTYATYTSSTLDAAPGQPTGASKLCLSCHDGTVALGDAVSETSPIPMAGGTTTLPPGPTNLGVDLTDDHPVSFAYTPGLAAGDGQLADPLSLTGPVRLDGAGEMQCTSCHDPHDDSRGDFLVADNTASGICITCHVRTGWNAASHKLSAATWNGTPPDPWPHTDRTTVADNACESCHNPHTASGAERLLNQADEEGECLVCHNGNVASTDIESEFTTRPYVHPIYSQAGVHDPTEPAVVTSRHVECVDCHNPHAANADAGAAPAVSGRLRETRGVDQTGAEITPAVNQYQVCFRCHADSPGKPAAPTPRQHDQTNVRLEFDTGNPSYHPVEGPGANPDVPSLLPPWTTSSVIYCTDCHTNDAGPKAGGTGPEGPHGSQYPHLLGWRYETTDPTAESAARYALCYRCHDRNSILGDQSFKKHKLHIQNEDAPCNVCHDPHGVSATQGTPTNNTHLINFDVSVVQPEPFTNRLEFIDNGKFHGECWLRCHGKTHTGKSY